MRATRLSGPLFGPAPQVLFQWEMALYQVDLILFSPAELFKGLRDIGPTLTTTQMTRSSFYIN